jgi:hypothetical protein
LLKTDAVDLRKNVDCERRTTHTKELAALGEILRPQAFQWGAEFLQGSVHLIGISGVRSDKEIDVLRGPRLRVQ